MSAPSAAVRLAFFGMEEPAPSATRARVDAAVSGVDEGPAQLHRLHGAVPIGPGRELRITTQPSHLMPNGSLRRPRMVVRLWFLNRGSWWTSKACPGITVRATDVADFARAVAEAAKYLASEVET